MRQWSVIADSGLDSAFPRYPRRTVERLIACNNKGVVNLMSAIQSKDVKENFRLLTSLGRLSG